MDNLEHSEDQLVAVSDPGSPFYGQHWTPQQVSQHLAPSPESVLQASWWLQDSGFDQKAIYRARDNGTLHVHMSVKDASKLLQTHFYHMANRKVGHDTIACTSYTIPEHLEDHVDFIVAEKRLKADQKTIARRSRTRRQMPTTTGNSTSPTAIVNCDRFTGPECLRQLYHIPSSLPSTPHPNNTFGIYQPAWVTWLPEDLDLFFQLFSLSDIGRRPRMVPVNGGYTQTEYKLPPFNLEPNLDFEYAMSLVSPMEVINLQIGDRYVGGNWNNMLAAFDKTYSDAVNASIDPVPLFPDGKPGAYNRSADCGTVVPPKVISISFAEVEDDLPVEYLKRQCHEFLKLGLMGTTVIAASGDFGVASGLEPGTCINATTGVSNATKGAFSPTWPGGCPWVTIVGGTQLAAHGGSAKDLPFCAETNETVFHTVLNGNRTLSSAGGFSNVFPAPAYQHSAVSQYRREQAHHLNNLDQEGFDPDDNGRGFPDLSVMAYGYLIAMYNETQVVHGTSASAPVFASMIAMINNERLHAGKSTVGFLNPALYAAPKIFNEIKVGNNSGCGASPAYRAANGWDPVTGLGSVDYVRLRDMLMDMP
ncbi:Tripeptidyl-peptidase SED1 [Pseudocercospora fuligena]|uniref:Tripeptidyl-peptidase SED1 n=1 Tax=Pseudocercospora fuligena TaxID=685502 RepID=A0A8H6RK37_9PEZI|nr:Tripeptidyl-peptidase SED1 [Pseudocercospora fuligena]